MSQEPSAAALDGANWLLRRLVGNLKWTVEENRREIALWLDAFAARAVARATERLRDQLAQQAVLANAVARANEVEKIAPVQGYAAGIPWAMHLRAYDAYCKRYGGQEALIDLEGRNCRGGFAVEELDMFIPGWREELSELHRLRARVAELEVVANDMSCAAAAMSADVTEIGQKLDQAIEERDTAKEALGQVYTAVYGAERARPDASDLERAALVCREVAELPDRTSPDLNPDEMIF